MHFLLLPNLAQVLRPKSTQGLMIDVLSVVRDGKDYTARVWIKAGESTSPKIVRLAFLERNDRSPRGEPGRVLYEVPQRLLPQFGALRPGVAVIRSVVFSPPRSLSRVVCPLLGVEAKLKGRLESSETIQTIEVETPHESGRSRRP